MRFVCQVPLLTLLIFLSLIKDLSHKKTMTDDQSTRDGSTSSTNVGACLSEDCEHSPKLSFYHSSHAFASNGNSSKITRYVKSRALDVCSIPVSRYKRRRRRKKQERLAKIPSNAVRYEHHKNPPGFSLGVSMCHTSA